MKKYVLFFSYFIILLSLVLVFRNRVLVEDETKPPVFFSKIVEVSDPNEYFYEAISYWPKLENYGGKNARGGIVPHHLPASPMIANFFSLIDPRSVENIVLVSPNHDEEGGCKVITTESAKDEFFSNLIFVCGNNSVIESEHGITTILPYIEYYLEDIHVTPVLFSNYASLDEVTALVSQLQNNTENTVFVGSVDFSHSLNYEQALKKDEETILLLQAQEYEKLIQLEQENLDSPETLIFIQKVLNLLDSSEMQIIAHENSAQGSSDKGKIGTSYFEIIWYENGGDGGE